MKWRRVPVSINLDHLPDPWTCDMNDWDESKASCDCPEDAYDSDNKYEYAKGVCALTEVAVGDDIDLFCTQKGGWCSARVKKVRKTPIDEYNLAKKKREEALKKDSFVPRADVVAAAEQAKALGLHVDLGADFVFEARCHYQGWRDKYDEWVEVPSWRIAAHHVYTEVTEKEKRMREKKKQEQLKRAQAEAAGAGSDDN